METNKVRLANVRAIIKDRFNDTVADFARAVDKDDAQVWAWLNGVRNIGERLARNIEEKLGPAHGALDQPPEGMASKFTVQQDMAAYGVPVVGTAQLGEEGFYCELEYPAGHGDGAIKFTTSDRNAYALRVKGDSMRPRIKPGEFVVVEPNHPPQPGEEVLVRTADGRVMVKVFDFKRDGIVQLSSINEAHRPITIDEKDIERLHYVAAIVKASSYRRSGS
jgi:phage repressor protein C with HTH and peptisase S24 domain